MKMGGNIEQCYNAQAAVGEKSQLIIANGLTNNAADNGELLPMIEAVKNNLGELPTRVLADSGYRSEGAFAALENKGWMPWWPWGAKAKIQRPLIASVIQPVRDGRAAGHT